LNRGGCRSRLQPSSDPSETHNATRRPYATRFMSRSYAFTSRWQLHAGHGMVHAVTSPFQRRIVVGASFVAAIVLVAILNRRAPGAGDASGAARFHLTNIAAEAGIDFVHRGPTLDAKLDNIAPLVSSLGASVSVADVNNDGWPDLYFTNSRFGYPNALYLNRG